MIRIVDGRIEKAEKAFDLPPFIPETGLDKWRTAIRAAYADGTRDFTVNSWHAFELLRDLQNIRIHVRYPFHISNSFAVKLAADLGAVSAIAAPECDEDNYSALKQNSILSLDKENAPQPLLVSRLPLTAGVWRDAENRAFRVEYDGEFAFLHAHDTPEVSG